MVDGAFAPPGCLSPHPACDAGIILRLSAMPAIRTRIVPPAKPNRAPERMPIVAARRLFMAGQGLLDDPSRPATPKTVYAAVERMGFVQVDTINVVERAHHLILAARFDAFRPETLARLVERDKLLFEHWTHDASLIPTRWFAHWKPRFERHRMNRWWSERFGGDPDEVCAAVLERVAREGPVMSRDFEHERNGEPRGWWGWKPQKAALERLWRTGDLMIARRVNFQKVYDLTPRVLPEHHALPRPTDEEHAAWACGEALDRLGHATPRDLAAFWNLTSIQAARAWCDRAARAGEIVPVEVESADSSKPRMAFARPDWKRRAARLPHAPDRVRLLCPFDPVLRDRARTLRLFGFDYRFEAFVPEGKRRYGYYVLPILDGERFIGRLDPKCHRDEGVLEIRGLWWEQGQRPQRAARARFDEALHRLSAFIGAQRCRFAKGVRR